MPLSGTQWVGHFPTSTSTADLTPAFGAAVDGFIGALRQAGATHSIAATYRPVERAHLMHWSWRIGRENVDPRQVPAMNGVDIDWVHLDRQNRFDETASRRAASAMNSAYQSRRRPSLTSHHTQGLAIDMNISWAGDLSIRDANNNVVNIATTPHDGMNTQLHAVAATFGVIKFTGAGDPPHWSIDGR